MLYQHKLAPYENDIMRSCTNKSIILILWWNKVKFQALFRNKSLSTLVCNQWQVCKQRGRRKAWCSVARCMLSLDHTHLHRRRSQSGWFLDCMQVFRGKKKVNLIYWGDKEVIGVFIIIFSPGKSPLKKEIVYGNTRTLRVLVMFCIVLYSSMLMGL